MKRIILLCLLAILSLPAAGQQAAATGTGAAPLTLQPRRIMVDGDTQYVYNSEQNRYLIYLLNEGRYDLGELRIREKQVDTLERKVRGRAVVIAALQDENGLFRQRIATRDTLIGRQEKLIQMQNSVQKTLYRKIRRDTLFKKLLWVGIVLAFVAGLRFRV